MAAGQIVFDLSADDGEESLPDEGGATMSLEAKSLSLELKAGGSGQFTAVFATLNVVDLDGDVTLPGAFSDGAGVLIGAWNHANGSLPVGKGVIREHGNTVRVEGAFFLDTPHGEAAYRTIRNLGTLTEWSYVFRVIDHSFGEWPVAAGQNHRVRFLKALDVVSVDPVARGAGVGTRTERIKSAAAVDLEREVLRFWRTLARQNGAAA